MKKFFYVLMAAAALVAVSCDKNNDNKENDENEGDGPVARKVLLALPTAIDEDNNLVKGRSFRYNEDGSLAGVDEVWTDEETGELMYYNLNVSRTGNKLTLTTDEGDVEYEWEVNEQGYVVKNGDYSYEYDNEGHLTKVIEDWGEGPQVVSICTWENGNMTSWTKEKENEGGSARIKRQTYKDTPNIGGIFTVFTEKSSLKKWMFEAGFFGKATKNLVATDKWDDNTDGASFEYRYDEDGYVITETKYWAGEAEGNTYYFWKSLE